MCTSTMYGILKGLGFRHNRPRHAPKPAYDSQAKAKMNAITEVLSSRVAGNHVVYEDESDLHLPPTLRSAWMLRGKQLRVPTPSTNQNQKKSVFGAMDIRTGAFMHLIFDRKRTVEFMYSIHKARSVQAWLAGQPRVALYFLPCYMPQLNPVEKVWRHMRTVVTANRLYGSMAALVAAVDAFFEQLTPSQVQALAA